MFGRQEIERAGFEEVLRQIPSAVMIIEAPSGETILANRQTQQMSERYLGCSELSGVEDLHDLHDKSVYELFHPDGRPYEFEEWPMIRSIKSGEEVRDEEIVQRVADGTQFTLRCDSSPIYDDEGRIVAGVVVTHDITERKRAEEKLAYHAYLLENIYGAVTATDERFVVTAWNKGAEQMFGWTADEALGRKVYEVIPTDYSDEHLAEALRELSETGRRRTEGLRYRKDGTPVHAEALTIALRGEQGQITGYVGIHRDITERKQAEEALRESSDRIQNILESITDAFYALDREWRLTYINERAVHVFRELKGEEFTREELLGQNVWEVFPNVVGTLVYEKYHQAVREQETIVFEYLYPGEGPWFKIHAYPSEEGLSVYFRDITERKRTEEKLEEVREAERSRIARDLHDDALQDLSGALVDAQLLHQAMSENPEAVRRAERLLAALDRIGPRLREAIYDLSLEAEQERPFSELLESLVELQRTIAPECDIRLDVQDRILSSPLQKTGRELLRIVREALINARRHSGAHNIRVSAWSSQEKLFAEVEDDGRGFDPAQEPSATIMAGIGLKGMRERARALGGVLKIESEPGKGTKVRLELALKKEREEAKEERVCVLLVEDHASLLEALASVFEGEAGFEVVGQAGSLAEARRMLDEVDVAVIDLGLPDGYGGDLIKELREANPQAQALVLSASLDRAEIAQAVERGAAGVLHKTAHLDEVMEAVRRLRAGETLMPLEEVVELLRFAGTQREQEYEARQAIEKLTPREREVLQALAEGLDSEGIAERLHIALRTERNHMASILAKLEVHSQLQALVLALRYGVVEIP